MKKTAYEPVEGVASVMVAIRETGAIVHVEGRYETDCPFEQRVLDSHRNVKRAAATPKPPKGPTQGEGATDTPTPKEDA